MLHRFSNNRSRVGLNMGAAVIFGIAFGAAFDNFALGIALGIALAAATSKGTHRHRDNKDEDNE